MSRRARLVVAAAVAAALVVVGVIYLPTRTWFGQERELGRAQSELAKVRAGNDALARKIGRLSDASSIEEQAREQYGFVLPGEESYTVPPATKPVVNLPPVWPFNLLQDPIARAAARQH